MATFMDEDEAPSVMLVSMHMHVVDIAYAVLSYLRRTSILFDWSCALHALVVHVTIGT